MTNRIPNRDYDGVYPSEAPDSKRQRTERREDGGPRYEGVQELGSGTFGSVVKARKIGGDQTFFAVKNFKNLKGNELGLTALREIGILRELHHENIIKLIETLAVPGQSLSVVFEYAEFDLESIIKKNYFDKHKKGIDPHPNLIRSCMWQILNGLHYIHSNWIIHRDMKPQNVMVMGSDSQFCGQVKIGDFGLARTFRDPPTSLFDNGVVVTIWYRAPELLFMSKHYTPAVDIWAAGCIFGELLTNTAMFPTPPEEQPTPGCPLPFQKEQVRAIFKLMGTPTVPLYRSFPRWDEVSKWEPFPYKLETEQRYSSIDATAMDLLKKLLEYDPAKRITAEEALKHEYFHQVFNESNIFAPGSCASYSVFVEERRREKQLQSHQRHPQLPQPHHRPPVPQIPRRR